MRDGEKGDSYMTKKPMNSLFLTYLINSENNLEEIAEKLIADSNNKNTKIINELDKINEETSKHLILLNACLGEIGWCLPKWKKQQIALGNVFADLKNDILVSEIDEKIADCFKEREIECLKMLIERKISNSEKSKLDLAFELYLKHEYFASAMLLAGLIDSVSINQALKTKNNTQNVSQCWKCYGKIIQEEFGGEYFNEQFPFNKSAKNNERGNATIKFFNSIKQDVYLSDNKKVILIPLSFALLKFFDDSDWLDKKNGIIPSSINRHWLAHNMYNYDDITRADCIKLFCMLYQIVELYSML